ncbi:hypothetical protein MUP38_07085 [Candidatus Bathyarchaeota archaeon]|nr:hypothetical protein [Candidatus Bathyarchaeota archaeon]
MDTIVYHVGENTEDGGYPPVVHIPDVGAVYQQILAANDGKYPNILLLPAYNGHLNWTEEKEWIKTNFADIPIMLEVFASTGGDTAFQLSTDDILEIMAVVEVKWIRIFEVVGWYGWHQLPFPQDYVIGILNFCKDHGLRVFWSEWSVWYVNESVEMIGDVLSGFEDIVTFGFGTNSGDLEPEEGFKWLRNLNLTDHWGASVQAWYWNTHHSEAWSGVPQPPGLDYLLNMPISWMITHANEAKGLGAEIIQFEPYWYFFGYDDGKARENLKLMHYGLNLK